MIIAVASGKGGTGKTTVALNLALSLASACLVDCDVEEPNINVFLKAPLYTQETVTVDTPEVDTTKCDYCGKCAAFCMYNALAVVPQKVLVFPELCHSCGGCALVCPRQAITWKKRIIGTIEYGTRGTVELYQGLLNIGEAQAIPLLKALKKKIDPTKHIIIDAPPGTACPVIEAVRGADYTLLVTEPTPFGLHDLKLMVAVLRHQHLPFGVIINRDGIGNDAVEQYCNTENIPVHLKIPHSEEIARLYSQGIVFVEQMEPWQSKFHTMYQTVQQEVTASSS
ncbi:MAG: ATP-binding protein [Candidatus Thermoplasmatota archaeon]|nr:ATP-binding protein [Candidatus Thermoplasmatota archaeon]